MLRLVFGLLVVSMWGGLVPCRAYAHPRVDEGRRRFERADFRGSLRSLERAEQEGGLDRDSVVLLLETRALATQGLGDADGLKNALKALAVIDPSHAFPPEAPPDLVELFAEVRAAASGPLALETHAAEVLDGVEVRAASVNDDARVVARVRVLARADSGPWLESPEGLLRVQAKGRARVLWYVEAIGPGGAVLLTEGTRENPRVVLLGAALGAPTEPASAPFARSHSRRGVPWLWVAAGGVAVGAAVAATVLVVNAGSSRAVSVGPPTVEW